MHVFKFRYAHLLPKNICSVTASSGMHIISLDNGYMVIRYNYWNITTSYHHWTLMFIRTIYHHLLTMDITRQAEYYGHYSWTFSQCRQLNYFQDISSSRTRLLLRTATTSRSNTCTDKCTVFFCHLHLCMLVVFCTSIVCIYFLY